MVWDELCEMVLVELNNANVQFHGFNSSHEGYAVIKEELEELWDAVKQKNNNQAGIEAIQIAAMAMQFAMQNMDHFIAVYKDGE